jgi:hypothetical protein
MSAPESSTVLPADALVIKQVDTLLSAALEILDAARRYDVAAHVDLAIVTLRGTRNAAQPSPIDIGT